MPASADGASDSAEVAFGGSGERWVLAIAVLGSGLAFRDGTVVNVELPELGRDPDASTSSLQWILNGYLPTLASLILLGGSLGDRHGRRRILSLGASVDHCAADAITPSAAGDCRRSGSGAGRPRCNFCGQCATMPTCP